MVSTKATAKAKQKAELVKLSAIDKLNSDCLRLVFEQVYLAYPRKLLTLSLVSAKFYSYAVPWIYQIITVDLSTARDLVLLHRLVRPSSQLPTYVRIITVKAPDQIEDSSVMTDLVALFALLVNVKKVVWESTANIPTPILDSLRKFPSANIAINAVSNRSAATEIQESSSTLTLRSLLRHPITSSQLTEFCFVPTDVGQFYKSFKRDLICLITSNPSLQKLWIKAPEVVNVTFPEMTDKLQRGRLPRLQILRAETYLVELFTVEEFDIWGDRVGWNRLETLYTRTDHVSAFIRRVPRLSFLSLNSASPSDIIELEEFL
jgi:hypothetical protein